MQASQSADLLRARGICGGENDMISRTNAVIFRWVRNYGMRKIGLQRLPRPIAADLRTKIDLPIIAITNVFAIPQREKHIFLTFVA